MHLLWPNHRGHRIQINVRGKRSLLQWQPSTPQSHDEQHMSPQLSSMLTIFRLDSRHDSCKHLDVHDVKETRGKDLCEKAPDWRIQGQITPLHVKECKRTQLDVFERGHLQP